jgi:hypothetical protein
MLIDSAIGMQGPPLGSTGGVADAVAAVPEPCGLIGGGVSMIGFAALRRRPRRRHR